MQNLTTDLDNLRRDYRQKGNWSCIPDLLQKLGSLTKSQEWGNGGMEDGIYLYGAGSIGAGALDYFKDQEIKVLGFIDDTPGREGTRYRGLDILPFNVAKEASRPIIISVKNWQLPAARLAEAGMPSEAYSQHVVRKNLDRVRTVQEDFLDDDHSRLVYLTMLKANLLADYSLYRAIREGNQYNAIEAFQGFNASDVMVDAGAYVGDSLEEYIWSHHGIFERIHAFEPNPKLLAALKVRTNRLCAEWALAEDAIVCVGAGLGETETEMPFFELDSGSVSGSFLFAHGRQEGALRVRTLDGYLAGARLSYLKADVEGFEMSLLRGARESIKKHRPRMALSVYHLMTDMIDIPAFVRGCCPEYRMALRHHSWGHDDTVLYCWI
jgi:FkbM family methyltransferase